MPKSCATLVSTCGTAHGARWGGGAWATCRRPWPHTCLKTGVQFSLPTRFLIPDPSPAPVPAGYWGAELRGSFVNRTPPRRLRFNRLQTPVLAKGVFTLYLPWLDSIERVRPGIPSLALRPLRAQTAKNVSIGRESAYRDCPFWLFTTWPGTLSLVHTSMNPHHHHQVWRQWWPQIDDTIKLKPPHPPAFLCPCHFPDVSLDRIWYGPDVLGVWRVHMLRWRHVGIDRGVRHGFSCDA